MCLQTETKFVSRLQLHNRPITKVLQDTSAQLPPWLKYIGCPGGLHIAGSLKTGNCMQDAALKLSGGEYWDLSVQQRVALLRCLCGLALGIEAIRDLFQTQAEALQLQQQPAGKLKAGQVPTLIEESLQLPESQEGIHTGGFEPGGCSGNKWMPPL